jgi:uncharacterized membrane protein
MSTMRMLYLASIALAFIEGLTCYSYIPARMAIHFNASGAADGWGYKQQFFIFYGVMVGVMSLLFWGLPLIIRLVPASMINLPNKEYWLAPERKELTLARLSDQMLFTGCMALLLMDGILFLVIKANLSAVPVFPAAWMWGLVVVFIAANIVWTINLIRSFRRPMK